MDHTISNRDPNDLFKRRFGRQRARFALTAGQAAAPMPARSFFDLARPVAAGFFLRNGIFPMMAKEIRITITPEKLKEIDASIDWDKLRAMTEEEIDRAIAEDPDASPLTEAEGMGLRIQAVRKRLALSQIEFAERFHIPIGTLRDWEQARRQPDAAAWAYIQVIDTEPEAVLRALSGVQSAA